MSGFKPRGYDRETTGKKVRDYSLFVIACEGTVQEPRYFRPFADCIDRIKVDIIDQEDGQRASAPKKVLERAKKYIADIGLSEKDGDTLWLIVDVDNWPREQHEELAEFCENNPNWNVVISNPCFEIWLLFHKKETLKEMDCTTPDKTKKTLNKIGYSLVDYLPLMPVAAENAAANDTNAEYYMPNEKETKVYLLAKALLERIGQKRFDQFIEEYKYSLDQSKSRKQSK